MKSERIWIHVEGVVEGVLQLNWIQVVFKEHIITRGKSDELINCMLAKLICMH